MTLSVARRLFGALRCRRAFGSTASPHHGKDEPVVGPGAPSDAIPSKYEQAAGLERLQYLADLSGRRLFLLNPLVVDHYGTMDDPIWVESMAGKRITGCTGFPKESHETMWFWTEEGKPGRCPECGQVFKIKHV